MKLSFAASRVACTAVVLTFALSCEKPAELPKLNVVDDFALLDQHEKVFDQARLKGTWSVASFIFTSCPSVCPALMGKAVSLHDSLKDVSKQVQFVSFSVDPETDTPKALRRYAVATQSKHDNWFFVTGETKHIGRVVQEGFKVAIGEKKQTPEGVDILHATHFVLVDPNAQIRGYYRSDKEGIARLEKELRDNLEP